MLIKSKKEVLSDLMLRLWYTRRVLNMLIADGGSPEAIKFNNDNLNRLKHWVAELKMHLAH
ncbi:MAG: hypothetical protein MRY49_02310 [Candidatus Pacebacteria bacterium]|nr:hypothetical protein [Candidatus Paceibacterota bacterium]